MIELFETKLMLNINTVLIADDESAGRDTLEAVFAADGYTLVFADSGTQALELATARQPDVVLLDIMMPGMDGFEVCRRLRANPNLAEVPIILLTALDDKPSRLRVIEAGADDFVSKNIRWKIAQCHEGCLAKQLVADRAGVAIWSGNIVANLASRQPFGTELL